MLTTRRVVDVVSEDEEDQLALTSDDDNGDEVVQVQRMVIAF